MILNFNGKNYLQQFLPSVFASAWFNKKIIIADNGSDDGSVEFLQKEFPSAELILLDKNYGFAGGYNKALQQAEADYYVLLNSDVEVTPGWIEPIIELMEGDNRVAACQPKILSYHKKEMFEYAGASGGWIDTFGYPFSRGRVFDDCEKDENQYDDVQPVFWASGAAMFIKAKVFHEVGGFDDFFFAHMEEIDLCWRLQLAGYTIMCCPASVVYHVGGGTLPKGNSRKVFLNFRNNLIMLSKNLPVREKIWKLPLRIMLDALFAWKSLSAGYSNAFGAVLKAHISVFAWWVTKKNEKAIRRKPLSILNGVINKPIVWAYFIKKKKRFSEIVGNKQQ